ncbi:MAG: lytic transglycosylase domain-containing protein [Bellilinea sp.]|jgi:hypothetical protein
MENNPSRALFPAIFIGVSAVILLTRLLLNPSSIAQASEHDPGSFQPAAVEVEIIPSPETGQGCPLSPQYPESILRWCDWIVAAASEHHLQPNLIAAVMLQESGGNPDAYSHSGAVGLMQVMPRDGLAAEFMCINGPCFANRPSMEELFDPQFNIEYGVRMLAGLIERKGDVREGLRSYGPMDREYAYADKVLSIYENYR